MTCVALMANLAVETWLRFLVWLAVGLVVYFVYGRTHSRLAPGPGRSGRRRRARRVGSGLTTRETDVCTRWGRVLKMQLALSLRE